MRTRCEANLSGSGRPERFAQHASVLALVLSGCEGPQSALDTAAHDAARIARLYWWMVGGSVVIWATVVSLAAYAALARETPDSRRLRAWLIGGGGIILPTLLLCGLLAYGLAMLPDLLATAPPGSLRVRVSGEQWWWRVQYLPAGAEAVDLANELRIPVDEPVEFEFESPDVIHSFWIPALGGKMDMIPGRTTRLRLQANRTGTFRGTCAEYCGASHALMAFPVVVMRSEEFAEWLRSQAKPAESARDPLRSKGEAAFVRNGCGACHTIRGTTADGSVGPDLTHVGSRLSLGAGTLANGREALCRWITQTDSIKPGAHMPAFGMLPASEVHAMCAYLEGLK